MTKKDISGNLEYHLSLAMYSSIVLGAGGLVVHSRSAPVAKIMTVDHIKKCLVGNTRYKKMHVNKTNSTLRKTITIIWGLYKKIAWVKSSKQRGCFYLGRSELNKSKIKINGGF